MRMLWLCFRNCRRTYKWDGSATNGGISADLSHLKVNSSSRANPKIIEKWWKREIIPRPGLEDLLFSTMCGNFRLRVPTGYQKTVAFEQYLSAQAWRYAELLLGDTWLKQRYDEWEMERAILRRCVFIADIRDVISVEQKIKESFHKNLSDPVQKRLQSVSENGSSIVDEVAFMHNVEVNDTSAFDSGERHKQAFNEKMAKDSTISDWKELITKKWSTAVRYVSDPDGDPQQKDGVPTNPTWIFHRCHCQELAR